MHAPSTGSGITVQGSVACAGLHSGNDPTSLVGTNGMELLFMVLTNDEPKRGRRRDYPKAGFTMERLGGKKRGSYPLSAKLNTVEFSRQLCSDGRPVGRTGAAKVLGVDKKRITEWIKDETKLKAHVENSTKGADKCRSVNPGRAAYTAEVEENLRDWIRVMHEEHHGVVRQEVLDKVLQLKPNTCGGLPSSSDPTALRKFNRRFDKWYARFRKRHMLSIRRPKVPPPPCQEMQS